MHSLTTLSGYVQHFAQTVGVETRVHLLWENVHSERITVKAHVHNYIAVTRALGSECTHSTGSVAFKVRICRVTLHTIHCYTCAAELCI